MDKQALIDSFRGGLIVSCQALPGEPMYVPEQSIMYLFARAAKQAGAIAIRTNGVEDVKAIKAETGLPVIGLIKRVYPDSPVYITPTLAEVDALVEAGADIVAADCTLRKRPAGQTVQTFINQVRRKYPDLPLMADISTYEEGAEASALGADFISTTLSGYTDNSPKAEGPDVALVRRLSASLSMPVIAEGRIHEPDQAAQMLRYGAWAVVVGGAITRPLEIANRFARAVREKW